MMSLAAAAHAYLKSHAGQIAKEHPALAAWLPLFGIALHAVHTEAEETGHDDSGAVTSVASTLTPGLANSQVLTESTETDALDGAAVDHAADAIETGDAATAVQALQQQPAPKTS